MNHTGKPASETQQICAEIVDYVENRNAQKCQFETFTGDFVKDENQQWYFLQAKSFVCRNV